VTTPAVSGVLAGFREVVGQLADRGFAQSSRRGTSSRWI